jgi:flagellar biosynthesis/type III secretory pathway protein FliH
MTSSSDAGLWRPLDLETLGAAVSAPESAWLPAAGADAGEEPGAWLPALHTDHDLAERGRVESAYHRGRDEAAESERRRADDRCATALRTVEQARQQLERLAGEFARDRERDLQALAVAVARHIVQHELTIDPLRVGELVRRALELLPLDHTIEVRLHPEDLRTLAPSLDRLAPENRPVKLLWMADPSLERGGFVLETPQRIVDGRTDTALRALYERFDHD